MRELKKGTIPVNARVDIDYSGTKPKIKFTYPKRNAIGQNLIGIHTYILTIIGIIIYFLLIIDMGDKTLPYPVNCNVNLNETNYYAHSEWNYMGKQVNYTINNSYPNSIEVNCRNYNYTLIFNGGNHIQEQEEGNIKKEMIFIISYSGLILFLFCVNYLITKYLVKQKWYQEWLPKHEARKVEKYYMKFFSKDVENNVIIIPNFKNVILQYNTSGDFNKYLDKISIREKQYYKFKKGKKVGKLKKDVYNWSAVFYFKQKPKDGFLEVIYR